MTDMAQLEAAWAAYWQVWTDVERTARQEQGRAYERGRMRYRMGEPDSACADANEVRGWYDACEADVTANPLLDWSNVDWDAMEVDGE